MAAASRGGGGTVQVRVASTTNVPDGAVLSIRAGSTRRQAPIAPARPLRFAAADLAEGEVKVDILQKVGHGTVCLLPPPPSASAGADSSSSAAPAPTPAARYRLMLNEDTGMSLELAIGDEGSSDPAAGDGGGDAAPKEDTFSKTGISAKESQEYLEQIGVLQLVQRVLQLVVKERPRKPLEFIGRQFLRGFDPPPQPEDFSGVAYREFPESGDKYEGEFLKGKRHGNGKYQFGAGDIYDGEWCEDEMHGEGRMHYSEGMYYEGHWAHGKHHGRGRYVWTAEQEEYEGDFFLDEFHGHGRYIYANDEVYEGDFANSLKHGRGRHILADGTIAFDGEYRNNDPVPGSNTLAAQRRDKAKMLSPPPPPPRRKRSTSPSSPAARASRRKPLPPPAGGRSPPASPTSASAFVASVAGGVSPSAAASPAKADHEVGGEDGAARPSTASRKGGKVATPPLDLGSLRGEASLLPGMTEPSSQKPKGV